jgi:hypothetical protein
VSSSKSLQLFASFVLKISEIGGADLSGMINDKIVENAMMIEMMIENHDRMVPPIHHQIPQIRIRNLINPLYA